MENPYQPTHPIFDFNLFFGQIDLLSEIIHLLQTNQSVSLVGPAKMGRTSVLHQIRQQETVKDQPEWIVVYLDCASFATVTPLAMLSDFAQAICHTNAALETIFTAVIKSPSFLAFDTAIRHLDRQGIRITLLLDDFEWLSDNPKLDVGFLNALRSTAARYNLSFCITSKQPLIELSYLGRQETMMTSPFFNIFSTLNLQPLPIEAAHQLVTKPAAQHGLTFPPEIVAHIIEQAAGHPYQLQRLAHRAFTLVLQDQLESWPDQLSTQDM